MNAISRLDLISGPLPVVLAVLASLGLLFLLLGRRRRWLLVLAVAAAVSAALTWVLNWYMVNISGLTAHDLPRTVIGWIGVAMFALVLMVANLAAGPWWRRLLAPVAAVVVVLTAATQVNAYFGQYRTFGDLTGASAAGIAPLSLPARPPSPPGAPPIAGAPVIRHWVKPDGLPGHGTVYSVRIPGTMSGFAARTGYVYLPPAYQAPTHPLLPVLVLIPGQPGSPADWLRAGRLQPVMDAFAATHQGLAPVVVVPDVNGSTDGNTMCMDSRIAKTDTYLAVDVPAWIKATLSVDTSPRRWAVGGFSFGGTCAIQMAALHPQIYPSAIDLSGEAEPALSADRAATIRTAFGGNTAAFDALTPLNVMARTRYPDSWVYFAAGAQDGLFTGYMHQVSAAAKAAGMTVTVHTVPGVGHAWEVPLHTLAPALDWLSPRLGLAP